MSSRSFHICRSLHVFAKGPIHSRISVKKTFMKFIIKCYGTYGLSSNENSKNQNLLKTDTGAVVHNTPVGLHNHVIK